jgi:putative transposase
MGRRRKREHKPAHRTDLLPSNLTAKKQQEILALLAAYRAGAVLIGREQWRLFFETAKFDKHKDDDKVAFAAAIGNAARVQMARHQVVEVLKSFISNRQNDFRCFVAGSSLDGATRHALRVINKAQAWFDLKRQIDMPENAKAAYAGQAIPLEIRRLARAIMRKVMSQHRRPNLSLVSMRLDGRGARLARPVSATQNGKVVYWLRITRMAGGSRFDVPLLTHARHQSRSGEIAGAVQVNCDRSGSLTFGVVTDIGAACAATRAAYDGAGEIALDFGLATLFGTSEGQLLGQGWLKRLRQFDKTISLIAASQQRAGKKPRESKRYCAWVDRLRGFIEAEVNRVLNKLVQDRRPKELVLERLDFRNPELSRRLNRIIGNCGRSVLKAKLAALEQEKGITSTEVNPAYTSQKCEACGYVDKRNRPSDKRFRCLFCGHIKHADLNAPRNISQRRALADGALWMNKASVLAHEVAAFMAAHPVMRKRHAGQRGLPADPRWSNPYFDKVLPARRGNPPAVRRAKEGQSPALVAA